LFVLDFSNKLMKVNSSWLGVHNRHGHRCWLWNQMMWSDYVDGYYAQWGVIRTDALPSGAYRSQTSSSGCLSHGQVQVGAYRTWTSSSGCLSRNSRSQIASYLHNNCPRPLPGANGGGVSTAPRWRNKGFACFANHTVLVNHPNYH
jgi:hypothetical protein